MTSPTEAVRTIIEHVARAYDYEPKDLLGRRRHKTLVEARHVAYWLARTAIKPRLSYPELGRIFDRRDHTTIMSGVVRMRARLGEEPELAVRVEMLFASALRPPVRKVRVALERTGT